MARETEDEGMLVEWWLGFFGGALREGAVDGWVGCAAAVRCCGVGSGWDDRELTWMAQGGFPDRLKP